MIHYISGHPFEVWWECVLVVRNLRTSDDFPLEGAILSVAVCPHRAATHERFCPEFLQPSHLWNLVLLLANPAFPWSEVKWAWLTLLSYPPSPRLSLALITIFVPKFITVWFQVVQRNTFHALLVVFLASCFSFSINFSIIKLYNAMSSFYMKHFFYNWIKLSS